MFDIEGTLEMSEDEIAIGDKELFSMGLDVESFINGEVRKVFADSDLNVTFKLNTAKPESIEIDMTLFVSVFGTAMMILHQMPALRQGFRGFEEEVADTADKWSTSVYRWKHKILGVKKTELRLMTDEELEVEINKNN